MLNNVLKKFQNTLNAGINNVKMIVNTLNETRPIISIHEKQYYLDALLAEGGYALIYKIQSVSEDKLFALKKINIQSSSHKKQIKREIKIWKELSKFGNIVELIDFEFTEKNVFIVMELCEEGTLLDFINNHEGNISEVEALLIFNQILLGVNAMHSQNPPIAHRDLKIENILKKKKSYKLCDFGSASDEIFDPTTSDEFIKEANFSNFEKHSTLYYRPPEMCDRYSEYVVSEKVDVWSLGCVLYTIAFKEQPFFNAQKLEIINGNYNFPKDEQKLYSEKFLDLIRVMLTPNPNNRPSVMQIMEWTNYWNETEKIPLSPEVEEIKKKQIKSGGLKNKSHKKKLLSAEEIERIQSKLKNKEDKKKKNYDDINELFGFSGNNEEGQKEENKKTKLDDDLFAVFSGTEKKNDIKSDKNEDLLDMEFYEVKEKNEPNNNSKVNINNDFDNLFDSINNTNSKKEENKNNNYDLLFGNKNENSKQIKNDSSDMKKTELNDLLNALNDENKKVNSDKQDLLNMNDNNITFKMNGQNIFSNFQPSEPKKEGNKKDNENVDLFSIFNKPVNTENEKKKEDDLFTTFSQTQKAPKEENHEKKETTKDNKSNKPNIEDLFSILNESQNNPKEEEKKKEIKIPNFEEDLFSGFNQPQTQSKTEKKDNIIKNNEDYLFSDIIQPSIKKEEFQKENKQNNKKQEDDLFAAFNQYKQEQKEEKNENEVGIKNNLEDELFSAFSQSNSKTNVESKPIKAEEDFFSGFSQPQEIPKKQNEDNNNISLEANFLVNKKDKNTEKKEIKNNEVFDPFNFGNSKKDEANMENREKNNDLDLVFSLNSNKENGGNNQMENGQSQNKATFGNDNNQSSPNSSTNNENKNQDIFAFFH